MQMPDVAAQGSAPSCCCPWPRNGLGGRGSGFRERGLVFGGGVYETLNLKAYPKSPTTQIIGFQGPKTPIIGSLVP